MPTISSAGVPGFEAGGLAGIWAPAKTPAAIIRRLNQEIVRAVNLPEVVEAFRNAASETVGSTPEEFAAAIRDEMKTLGKVITDAGIRE